MWDLGIPTTVEQFLIVAVGTACFLLASLLPCLRRRFVRRQYEGDQQLLGS